MVGKTAVCLWRFLWGNGRFGDGFHSYFYHLITYIHQNPVKHGFVSDFCDWPYSSYRTILSTRPTRLAREEVLDWFDGIADFEAVHQILIDPTSIRGWLGDEEP